MGITAAIARVKKGVKKGGLPAVVAELGEQLRSDSIPARLRPAASRIADLLRVPAQRGEVASIEHTHSTHAHDSLSAGGVCPFTGVGAEASAATQLTSVQAVDDVAGEARPLTQAELEPESALAVHEAEQLAEASLQALSTQIVTSEQASSEPAVETVAPAAEAVEPAVEAVEPAVEAVEPAVEAVEPAVEAVKAEPARNVVAEPPEAPKKKPAARAKASVPPPPAAQPAPKNQPAAKEKDKEKLAAKPAAAKTPARPEAKAAAKRPSAKASGKRK